MDEQKKTLRETWERLRLPDERTQALERAVEAMEAEIADLKARQMEWHWTAPRNDERQDN